MVRSFCVTVGRPIRPSPDPPPNRHGPGRHSRHSVVQPAPAHPAAGHCPPGHSYPAGRRHRVWVRGAGGPWALPGRAGVVARPGPGAGLRGCAGQLRPAPQPAPPGVGAAGAVVGLPAEPALGPPPGPSCARSWLASGTASHSPTRAGSPLPLTRFCLRPHTDPHQRRLCGSGAPGESAGVGAEGAALHLAQPAGVEKVPAGQLGPSSPERLCSSHACGFWPSEALAPSCTR
jgi:hypothetical protein